MRTEPYTSATTALCPATLPQFTRSQQLHIFKAPRRESTVSSSKRPNSTRKQHKQEKHTRTGETHTSTRAAAPRADSQEVSRSVAATKAYSPLPFADTSRGIINNDITPRTVRREDPSPPPPKNALINPGGTPPLITATVSGLHLFLRPGLSLAR